MQITTARVVLSEAGNAFTVMANDKDGRECLLLDVHLPLERATRLARKVMERGEIDVDYWLVRAPYGTAAWMIDAEEDRQIEDEHYGF